MNFCLVRIVFSALSLRPFIKSSLHVARIPLVNVKVIVATPVTDLSSAPFIYINKHNATTPAQTAIWLEYAVENDLAAKKAVLQVVIKLFWVDAEDDNGEVGISDGCPLAVFC